MTMLHRSLCVALFSVLGLAGRAQAQAQSDVLLRQPPTISVSGTAEVRVVPDEIDLHIGVETRDRNLETAKSEQDRRYAGLMQFLRQSGIEAKQIQTDFISIQPSYENNGSSDRTQYFTVQRNIGVRLHRIADFEKILTGALKSGANTVQDVAFRTTELRKHRDRARQLAIHAAREKAEALASELGVKVGKPQSITENTYGGWNTWAGRALGYMNQVQNTFQSAPAAATASDTVGDLAVGQISISAEIHVSFLLVP